MKIVMCLLTGHDKADHIISRIMSGREDLYKGLIVPDASLLTVKQRQIDEKIDINTRM